MNSSTNAIAPAGTEARAERKLTTPTKLRDTHKKSSAFYALHVISWRARK